MSGVVRSVKKIFKKVAKVVKKVAPYALAAAAVIYTVTGAAGGEGLGGWGNASKQAAVGLFGEGLLADTVAGSLTQAGFGALLGGGVGAMTDAGFEKGMQYGAAGGAITGGVTGFAGSDATLSEPGSFRGKWLGADAGGAGTPVAGNVITGGTSNSNIIGGAGDDIITGSSSNLAGPGDPRLANLAPVSQPVPSLDALTPGKTGLLRFWDEVKNSELASGMVGGAMQAVGGMLGAGDDEYGRIAAAEVEAEEKKQARRDAWIGTAGQGGLLTQSSNYASPHPTPGDKWNYKVDPTTKQLTGV